MSGNHMKNLFVILLSVVVLSGCGLKGHRGNPSDLEISPCANFSGSQRGAKELRPKLVFDDGSWTYFKLGNLDKQNRFPAFYRLVGKHETPANTRVVNNTVIAESTSNTWVLRNGDDYICVQKRGDNGE